MKNVSLSSLLIILFFSSVQSQATLQWESRYNGPTANDRGNKIVVDDSGNVYVTGKSDGSSSSDYLTIKYNANGDTLWTARYNGTADGEDEAVAIAIDKHGNTYVTGKSKGANSGFDIVTIKYNSDGVQQWVNSYNGSSNTDDFASNIVIDVFGNSYICGSSGNTRYSLVYKLSALGLEVWSKEINVDFANQGNIASTIILNNTGNIIVGMSAGIEYKYEIYEYSSDNGIQLFKYNTAFNSNAQVGGVPDKILADPAGNIYVLSTADDNINTVNPVRVSISKFSYRVGEPVWSKALSGTRIQGIDLKLDKEINSYVLVDILYDNLHKIYVNKYNSIGVLLWSKFLSDNNNVDKYPIALAVSNLPMEPFIYATGYTSTGNIQTSKYTSNGDSLWTQTYDCGNNGIDKAADMVMDKSDNIYITGSSDCNNTNQDVKTIKYSTSLIPSISPGTNTAICQGDSVSLSTSLCSGCTYLWSTNQTTQSIKVSPTITTNYTVRVTYSDGSSASSLPKIITVSLPSVSGVSISASTTSICLGQSVTFTPVPTNGGSTPAYQWYVNNLPAGSGPTFATTSLTNSAMVHCIMTSNAMCVSPAIATSNTITMTVNQVPIAAITGADAICTGTDTTWTASGGGNYLWNTGATTAAIKVNMQTTYTVTTTSPGGCTSTISKALTVNSKPDAAINGAAEICFGSSTIWIAGGGGSYIWNTGASTSALNINTAGTYTVTVTNSTGCTSSVSKSLTMVANPTATVTGANIICEGSSTAFTATGGGSYVWSTGSTSSAINVNLQGTYSVTVTSTDGCVSTGNRILTVNPDPTAVISGVSEICSGSATTWSASGGNNYMWSTGASSASVSLNIAGTYTITVTDANSCTSSAQKNLKFSASPECATCSDGIKNGTETGVDCGGSCPACPTCINIAVEIRTDAFPYEISWNIKNSDGITMASKANYNENHTIYTNSYCLNNGCYTFNINDGYGDGIISPGYFKILLGNTEIVNNSPYTLAKSANFCLGSSPAPTCTDGIKNGNETGTDCGGGCPPCPTCNDGIQNGNETGIDCGGSCSHCPTCSDGIKNGTETGVDCGGSCPACPTCTDGIKNGNETGIDCGGSCHPCPTCSDGIKNGNETGIDCGGACPTCATCMNISVEIRTDQYPQEISWNIKNSAGTIVASGGNYTSKHTLIKNTYCLNEGCYTFNITDSFGDGILSPGYFKVLQGTTELVSYSPFSKSKKANFCLGTTPPPNCNDGIKNGNEIDVDCGGSCPPCDSCTNISVEIRTDAFPYEISWNIKNSDGTIIASRGNYNENNAIYKNNCCLNNGCYTFNINDGYGDGIISPGYFKIFHGNTEIVSNSPYTLAKSVSFCLPSSNVSDGFNLNKEIIKNPLYKNQTLNAFDDKELSIIPNPADRIIQISINDQITKVKVLNLAGQIMVLPQRDENNALDISGLNGGMYIIQVETEKGMYSRKFVKR